MTVTVSVKEARERLDELLDSVASGDQEVIIERGGKPVAHMLAYPRNAGRRVPGMDAGKVWMADDFNAPLPEDALGGS